VVRAPGNTDFVGKPRRLVRFDSI